MPIQTAINAVKFSIVITTYNRLSLLKRAIDSALAQTTPCEVIVADNASTDGTEDYVRSFGDRVVYRRNATNLNHSGAVNAGVEAATGDWIKLLDDDDYLAPNCIEEMTGAIALRPEAVICSCQAAQVNEQEEELSQTPPTGPGKVFYIPQADIHYGMLLEVVPFGTPAQVAFQREAFLKSGGWDLTMTSCDDIDSWIRIAQFGDALFINQCLSYRTVWSGGYDQKISLQQRRDTNLLIKERIHRHIDQKYRAVVPNIGDISRYLQLHWSIVAFKQKRFAIALSMAFPTVFSPTAWRLLLQAAKFRKQGANALSIRKEILVNA
ncbi:MAG: glycosyltransferase family 2 protein [Leptolyngbyaceae cyanobacterium MO_188.B28]|nr:glycosyltransferase family 2 protein [Leptolyngbyaceae cyanobacterium MO_188.B28]